MNTLTWTNDPLFIGWEKMFNQLSDVHKLNNGGFPPYNVLELEEDKYLIELAVAGYKKSELDITEENRNLTIKGEKSDSEEKYIHKGIAGRKFTKTFSLAEHMEVSDAKLNDGILSIIITRNIPEEKKPKAISIK
jgi:molecular chaperone IbpA